MSTIQIGQRLVRTFGNGEKLKTIVTETIGEGKTLTKVLDSNGNLIQERLKSIIRNEKVGDKFVNTITKVTRKGEPYSIANKVEINRVYDSEFKKLGQRIREYINRKLSTTNIKLANGDRLSKTFMSSGHPKYEIYKYKGNEGGGYHVCNAKGLPTPFRTPENHNQINAIFGYNTGKLSLKEMRKIFQEKFPANKYSTPAFSFSSLDERVPGEKITDLDMFL